MPGALIPGDMQRIAEHQGVPCDMAWIEKHFLASEGAQIRKEGKVLSIRSIVPAQQPDGRCVFLTEAGRCSVHAVSPFGCAYFDSHMSPQPSSQLSKMAVMAQMLGNEEPDGLYAKAWEHLNQAGLKPAPLEERRMNYFRREELAEAEKSAAAE
jgi:Fe-S-cluster containining protein